MDFKYCGSKKVALYLDSSLSF